MTSHTLTKGVRVTLMTILLVAGISTFLPLRAGAIGVAYCFIEHWEAGDDVEHRRVAKYALLVRESRSEARDAAYHVVNDTLEKDYSELKGKNVYEHGEAVRGPLCDTWAFPVAHWYLVEVEFEHSIYKFHTVVAGVGTTEDSALTNAQKNLGVHNWAWAIGTRELDRERSGVYDSNASPTEVVGPPWPWPNQP